MLIRFYDPAIKGTDEKGRTEAAVCEGCQSCAQEQSLNRTGCARATPTPNTTAIRVAGGYATATTADNPLG